MHLLALLGVGRASWQDGVNLALDFVTRPEPLVFLWALPALLLFAGFSLLHRTLSMKHEGWRRLSIVAIGCALVMGLTVAVRGAFDPLSFFYGVIFFALPLLLVVLLLIQGVHWICEGFGKNGKEAHS